MVRTTDTQSSNEAVNERLKMLFKFPQKKIVLDCFTDRENVLRAAPVEQALRLAPEWWKVLPSVYNSSDMLANRPTMKTCAGFRDYYSKAIAIPLWSDLLIQVHQDRSYQWQYSDRESQVQVHDTNTQAPGFLPDYGHMKLVPPWYFKTNESVGWVWTHPAYNFKDSNDLVSLPAVVDYQYQHGTGINLMVNLREPKQILVPQGQPMVLMVPMSDRKVEIVRHLVSTAEMERITKFHSSLTFINKFTNFKKRAEQFEKCPFHKHV